MRGLLAIIYTTNTSRYYSLRYMSQAKNVTPELVMEQETISAAMEMAKPNWFASSEQAVRAAKHCLVD
jgi:hypothetical protein